MPGTPEKRIRNAAIRAAWGRGYTIADLSRRYGLSWQRVRQIVDTEAERERRRRLRTQRRERAAHTTNEGREAA